MRRLVSLLFVSAILQPVFAQQYEFTVPAGSSGNWNNVANWVVGGVPAPGLPGAADDVLIVGGGTALIQDGDNIVVRTITIDGAVRSVAATSASIEAVRIDVRSTGVFEVGTIANPCVADFTIKLRDEAPAPAVLDESQLMVMPGGTLSLVGNTAANKASWVRLTNLTGLGIGDWQGAHPSVPNDLMLLEPTNTSGVGSSLNWQIGDEIAVTSTDFDWNQAEQRSIFSGPTNFGGHALVQTDSVLSFRHFSVPFATTKMLGGVPMTVDMRASVALLNRNLRVIGTSPVAARWGGDIMIMSNSSAVSSVLIKSVELTNMGKYGALGRYPVHFHLCGDMASTGPRIEDCAIHDCHNRCLVIHRTDGVRVANNVFYKTWGHAFFLEDGKETGNVIEHNLGFGVRFPEIEQVQGNLNREFGRDMSWSGARLPAGQTTYKFFRYHDRNPTVFWLSHLANTVRDNIAAGSDGYGFAFDFAGLDLPSNATSNNAFIYSNYYASSGFGPAADHQRVTLNGAGGARDFEFARNTAHSCATFGIIADNDGQGRARPVLMNGTTVSGHASLEFSDCTAFKCRTAGIWYRQYGEAVWSRARVSDCSTGVYLASEGYTEDGAYWGMRSDTPAYPYVIDDVFKAWSGTSGFGPVAPAMSHQLLIDSVVVGDSDNFGHDPALGSGNKDWVPFASAADRSLASTRFVAFWPPSTAFPGQAWLTCHTYSDPGISVSSQDAGRRAWIKGFDIYDGLNGVVNTTFERYEDRDVAAVAGGFQPRLSGAFGTKEVGSVSWVVTTNPGVGNPWEIDPRNYVSGLSFSAVDHKIAIPAPRFRHAFAGGPAWLGWMYSNALNDVLVNDLDGSLTGSGPGCVFTDNAQLMRTNGTSNFKTYTTTTAQASYTFHLLPASDGQPAQVQIEYPWSFTDALIPANSTDASGFENLLVTTVDPNQVMLTRLLYDQGASGAGLGTVNPALRSDPNRQGLKRIFGANLLVGGTGTAPLYEVEFDNHMTTAVAPVPPFRGTVSGLCNADFAARVRFGPAGGSVILCFRKTASPVAVDIVAPPLVQPPLLPNAYRPATAVAFAPTTTDRYRVLASLPSVAFPGPLQAAGVSDGFWFDSGTSSLYVKLTLPTRTAGPGNNGVFSGAERIVEIRY
ncbi:MAG: hypothetical protein KDE27_09520 [Planctomycetes bacterium]|nr:hypothetical protein [Planctomycetota bacterium]